MSKITAVATGVVTVLKMYPALSAALVNFGVFAAGYFGLHLTSEQLVAYAGVLVALFGIIVHSNVTPLAKLEAVAKVVAPVVVEVAESKSKPVVPVTPATAVPETVPVDTPVA